MQSEQFTNHLTTLQDRWESALAATGFDAAMVAAGGSKPYFLDDQAPPFRPNPHFAQWYPERDCQGSLLLIRPGALPTLFFLKPDDYWHMPPDLPSWTKAFEVATFATEEALQAAMQEALQGSGSVAMVAEDNLSNLPVTANPPALLHHLHFGRAWKTPFELDALRRANVRAAAGHLAAAEAFADGASEFAIHLAYLAAAGHTPDELPYPSIVARNEHAGILHYQHYSRQSPTAARSFLIDAGASADGYAADVTRTYAGSADDGAFAALVELLEAEQLALIAAIRPGINYLDLHIAMHQRLGQVLATSGIVKCSAQAAFELGITRSFLPHGLGHLLGLQTHDIGGQQQDTAGIAKAPPAEYPALRFTREISPDMVFTIEPGLYFIAPLLAELETGAAAGEVDWALVEQLRGFGGIRIEDNVRVTASGTENLTRDAFEHLSGTAAHS